MKRLALGSIVAVVIALAVAGTGSAAPRQPQMISCNGRGDIMVLVGPANGAENAWGAAQVIGDGHLIPTSFTFSAFDNTTSMLLFSDSVSKGNGHANHNQQTTSCGFTQTGTLADLLEPGEQPPPGASLTDSVTITFSATVVVKS